jgi:hypothetical protein
VSNVFHSCPHVQHHLSFLRGDQLHCGQRMRGPEGWWVFSFSCSRSGTMTGLLASGLMPAIMAHMLIGNECRPSDDLSLFSTVACIKIRARNL